MSDDNMPLDDQPIDPLAEPTDKPEEDVADLEGEEKEEEEKEEI